MVRPRNAPHRKRDLDRQQIRPLPHGELFVIVSLIMHSRQYATIPSIPSPFPRRAAQFSAPLPRLTESPVSRLLSPVSRLLSPVSRLTSHAESPVSNLPSQMQKPLLSQGPCSRNDEGILKPKEY